MLFAELRPQYASAFGQYAMRPSSVGPLSSKCGPVLPSMHVAFLLSSPLNNSRSQKIVVLCNQKVSANQTLKQLDDGLWK
jgi:hypothetical protein